MTSVVRYHHVKLWVSNALQAACWYCVHYGFTPLAFTHSDSQNSASSHVIRLNNIIFVIQSPNQPGDAGGKADSCAGFNRLILHGDAVYDVAFEVDNLELLLETAKTLGAQVIKDLTIEKDEFGCVKWATIKTIGDTVHTLIEGARNYGGIFLPGYKESHLNNSLGILLKNLPPVTTIDHIDHVAANDSCVDSTGDWYIKTLNFHRFWTTDSVVVDTGKSALRIGSFTSRKSNGAKLVISQPWASSTNLSASNTSQIQEFLSYNGGSGVQHIAFYTQDIIKTVSNLKQRGCEFLTVPDAYYKILEEKLKNCAITTTEDLGTLKKFKILVDCDEKGYLLQIFTKPLQDRPTLFLELIQRHNHEGFGAGNIKSLFKAIELDQEARGNLRQQQ